MNVCSCNISFHKKCIEQWFDTIGRKSCPMCRRIENKYYSDDRFFADIITERIVGILDRGTDQIFYRMMNSNSIICTMILFMIWIVYSLMISIFIAIPLMAIHVLEVRAIPFLVHRYNLICRWIALLGELDDEFILFHQRF